MSKESLVTMLKTLLKYNEVQIEHTFRMNDQPQITVKCVKGTHTIEITYLDSQTIHLFDNLEEAAEAIQLIINPHVTV